MEQVDTRMADIGERAHCHVLRGGNARRNRRRLARPISSQCRFFPEVPRLGAKPASRWSPVRLPLEPGAASEVQRRIDRADRHVAEQCSSAAEVGYIAMFVGAGLTFAGATNICGMAIAAGPDAVESRAESESVQHHTSECAMPQVKATRRIQNVSMDFEALANETQGCCLPPTHPRLRKS